MSLLFITVALAAADWDREAATRYLDTRQKAWAEWPTAKAAGGSCMSCHTGMTYLLARPLLRDPSSQPTPYETALTDGLRARVATMQEPTPKNGVESVMAALFLSTEPAFDRMWKLQIQDGPKAGSWPWFNLDLDPYEMPESSYFGASLAAMAVAKMPAEYRARPDIRPRVKALTAYLRREAAMQPLHNRLTALWASTKLPEAMSAPDRKALLEALWKARQPDGGWTLEAMGPWSAHKAAPPQPAGSHNYATAWPAMVLTETGSKDKRLKKALDWLRAHQERETGAWPAPSMNKIYKEGSMMTQFLGDAATGYAVIALTHSKTTR
ncbi:MAG: hypothetical protein SGI92_29915 [Bryobacteraceae bacterium]|nr:hypothetical protein [Bryobacteraceae bacterium]